MSEDRTFDIIESRNAIPSTTRKTDGFSRQDVVNAFQRAFTMIGGVQRLALWANANPDKFFPLYAKLMPSTSINIGDNSVVQIVHALAPTALDRHPSSNDERGPPNGERGHAGDGPSNDGAPPGGGDQVEGRLREDFLGQPDVEDVQHRPLAG